jgi:hypothetical protein
MIVVKFRVYRFRSRTLSQRYQRFWGQKFNSILYLTIISQMRILVYHLWSWITNNNNSKHVNKLLYSYLLERPLVAGRPKGSPLLQKNTKKNTLEYIVFCNNMTLWTEILRSHTFFMAKTSRNHIQMSKTRFNECAAILKMIRMSDCVLPLRGKHCGLKTCFAPFFTCFGFTVCPKCRDQGV